MSYGYGLSATPLQIAQAYAALGNGGKLIAPTFVKGQRNEAHAGARPGDRARSHAHDADGDRARRHRDAGARSSAITSPARPAPRARPAAAVTRAATSSFFAGVVPVRQPALLDGGGGQRSRPELGYFGGLVSAPVFQQRHGRRAAPDGRGAGRHRHLARRAGRGRGQAQAQRAAVAAAPAATATLTPRCRPTRRARRERVQ